MARPRGIRLVVEKRQVSCGTCALVRVEMTCRLLGGAWVLGVNIEIPGVHARAVGCEQQLVLLCAVTPWLVWLMKGRQVGAEAT